MGIALAIRGYTFHLALLSSFQSQMDVQPSRCFTLGDQRVAPLHGRSWWLLAGGLSGPQSVTCPPGSHLYLSAHSGEMFLWMADLHVDPRYQLARSWTLLSLCLFVEIVLMTTWPPSRCQIALTWHSYLARQSLILPPSVAPQWINSPGSNRRLHLDCLRSSKFPYQCWNPWPLGLLPPSCYQGPW